MPFPPDCTITAAAEIPTRNAQLSTSLAHSLAILPDVASSVTAGVNTSSAVEQEPISSVALTSAGLIEALEPGFASSMPRWKRGMDIAGSILGLLLLSPIFLFTAILIKLVSPGPVFFKQERVGHRGILFLCWKFRTMKVDADKSVHEQYVRGLINSAVSNSDEKPMVKLDSHDDFRIIPFGRILRIFGIDELPQLINVLDGDMSLVGPRPCLVYEAQQYLPWQCRRFDAVPGLTGLWQVSGKNKTSFNEMICLDIAYVEQQSLWLDLKILVKTLPAVVAQVRDR
jgi:lipopolysaccharide/colanic/teichoic acid biosynthesis glycosyltransferase